MVSDNQTHIFDQPHFEFIKEKYGYYASWAIWADEGENPKENVGDLSVFDISNNPELLQQLNPNMILVGLNISRGQIGIPRSSMYDLAEQMDIKSGVTFEEVVTTLIFFGVLIGGFVGLLVGIGYIIQAST